MPTVSGRDTAAEIGRVAARYFYERGYEATTLREVAAAVGIKAGSLYNHITGKDELLRQIMVGVIDDLLEQQAKALSEEDGDEVDRLLAALDCHIRFHAMNATETFIGNSELRSLQPNAREEVVLKRQKYSSVLRGLIEDVGAAGKASIIDARLHTFSIVAQATHIASWYREDGPLSLDEIVSVYEKFALRELLVADADSRVDSRMAARRGAGHQAASAG